MKNIVLILLLILSGCSESQVAQIQYSTCFFEHFPTNQRLVLKDAVGEFNRFLRTNYPTEDRVQEKTIAYLKDMQSHGVFNPNWIFNRESSKAILEAYESSELRKSIYTRGEETESFEEFVQMILAKDSIGFEGVSNQEQSEMDSMAIEENRGALYFNEAGSFRVAVISCSNYWPMLESYYNLRKSELNINPSVIIGVLEKSFQAKDYKDPVLQSIIFVELFSWQMNEDLKRS